MNKKALKSLEADIRKSRKENKISFNKNYFNLGNLFVITDELNKETRDVLIEDYKKNKFLKQIEKNQPIFSHFDNKKQYIILAEYHAKQIIKDNLLKPIYQLQEQFGIKMKPIIRLPSVNQAKKPSFYAKIKRQFTSKKMQTLKTMHSQILAEKNSNDESLRTLIEEKCLKIDRQIFIKSIVMIIEKELENQNQNELPLVKSFAIFEQPYPVKEFQKNELVSMIGEENYEMKLLTALKVHHFSMTNETFNNPLFQTCHQCMRVKSTLEFPQNNLFCPKKIQQGDQKHVTSKYVYSPFTYMKRIIKREHFNNQDEAFSHPYIQYHTKGLDEEGVSCKRRWCGFCVINGRKKVGEQQCEFCDFNCKCSRCRKFEKMMKLLAYYFNYGQQYHQIRPKFLFSQVFETQHFNQETKKNKLSSFSRNSFPYKDELRTAYDKNQVFFHFTKKWDQLPFSRIISGSRPQSKRQFDIMMEDWETDKMRVIRNPSPSELKNKKKNKRKTHGLTKALNIEARINNLSDQTKKKFIDAALEQERLLGKELLRSGIIRSVNPMENQVKGKKDSEIIIKQTELQRKERKFYSNVPFFE